MVLGICDDNELFRKQLVKVCQEFIEREKMIVDIREYSCGEEAIEDSQDILLLDIDMPGMNGIEVKNYFEKEDRSTFIIYVSGYNEYMIEAFGRNVLGYINRCDVSTQLENKLKKACTLIGRYVLIGNINSHKVVYIEKVKNEAECKLVLSNGESVTLKKKLEKIEEEVKNIHFCKIERSVLVNFEYTKIVKDGMVKLHDNTIMYVSRRRKKKAEEAFWEYLRKLC